MAKSIRECVNLEKSTDKNLKVVVKLAIPDLEKIKISIKDRSQVEDVEREIEENTKKNDKYVHSLKSEIKARKILLTALDQAEEFYNNQRGDVKVVVNVSISYFLFFYYLCNFNFLGLSELWQPNKEHEKEAG